MSNLLYFNFVKYNIFYIVAKVQLSTKRIICSKCTKLPKNTFFQALNCVFSLDFGHEVSFTNISHYSRIKYITYYGIT